MAGLEARTGTASGTASSPLIRSGPNASSRDRRPFDEKGVDPSGIETTAAVRADRVVELLELGIAPSSVTADDTMEYGTGAFLLAGSEMLKLAGE